MDLLSEVFITLDEKHVNINRLFSYDAVTYGTLVQEHTLFLDTDLL